MNIDPWILSFSAITVAATIFMGFWSARRSKTASDFFVAGRSVSVGWNASAISGEYLSAASFMGVAGMVMSSGYDALWYPVCYACGYLFLLLFIAGPLRRFGAYTIPDFAEGRYDSPIFRKIAVIFVMFIGFFYTMPQMKGAGTTLAYIFPGLPYWVGVALVGAVITLNVALGGMKGITLVQAFQYWIKLFAICVPIFVLMSVYGHYGKQLVENLPTKSINSKAIEDYFIAIPSIKMEFGGREPVSNLINSTLEVFNSKTTFPLGQLPFDEAMQRYGIWDGNAKRIIYPSSFTNLVVSFGGPEMKNRGQHLEALQRVLLKNNIRMVRSAENIYAVPLSDFPKEFSGLRKPLPEKAPADAKWISPFGPLTTKAAAKAGLKAEEQKPFSLLYTYSLIIALVCGTAGLPHILVRFYTNPDGVAAKRTTMWVMILIGVFYVFPPVFGVMGRNLLPELYLGAGSKGTDKVVLELPRILNERGAHASGVPSDASRGGLRSTNLKSDEQESGATPDSTRETRVLPNKKGIPWGSILSGITCAGAFAAFMSTFSGLLVSMTGALAHDVYGRILRPKSTPEQRMRMFKFGAVLIGAVAILLGMQVEQLEINFMVGQAFAIAAASYFPLLFMSVWWRGMTQKGAATGMLTGGLLALAGITLTSVSDIALKNSVTKGIPNSMQALETFWIAHPAIRIMCEQPAIWAVPLAITLMIVVSKLTRKDIPSDVRMKMLVLHAPEKLGLKQEYIQEHQSGH